MINRRTFVRGSLALSTLGLADMVQAKADAFVEPVVTKMTTGWLSRSVQSGEMHRLVGTVNDRPVLVRNIKGNGVWALAAGTVLVSNGRVGRSFHCPDLWITDMYLSVRDRPWDQFYLNGWGALESQGKPIYDRVDLHALVSRHAEFHDGFTGGISVQVGGDDWFRMNHS